MTLILKNKYGQKHVVMIVQVTVIIKVVIMLASKEVVAIDSAAVALVQATDR